MTRNDLLQLRLTPRARVDLEEIWLYSARSWSETQADQYIDKLTRMFDTLRVMPELGRKHHEFTPPVRVHPIGKHVIIYNIEGEVLLIIRVLGAQQNWRIIVEALDL